MNIVILDGYAANPGDLSWEAFKSLGSVTYYDRTPLNLVSERIGDAEVIIINKIKVDKKLMDEHPKLKYIGILATGYNTVDVTAAHKRGITVTNIPAYSTNSVTQMVFAHLLTATNHVEHYTHEARQGKWSSCPDFCYWDTPLPELYGKTFAIVGFGHIGSHVAHIAQAFGMNVIAVTSKEQQALPDGITKASMEEALRQADVLSLHCPLTEANHHLINSQSLAMMQAQAILINTGRGPLVDEHAVAKALSSGKLGAYCADVMEEEPPSQDNPLLTAPRAFITPHIGWATHEARGRLLEIAFDNLKSYVQGEPKNVVS